MLQQNIEKIIKKIEQLTKESIKSNLKGIILFGSGNNKDYISGVSDLDFFVFMNNITAQDLIKLNEISSNIRANEKISIDLKPISLSEIKNLKKLKTACIFFNGWFFEAVKTGRQKIIYSTEELKQAIENNRSENISEFALERVFYYLHKLRKLLAGKQHLFHNEIKNLDSNEKNKIIVSCFKNILTFYLAHKGIFVYSNDELLENCPDKTLKNYLKILLNNKSNKIYDVVVINTTYDYLERYLLERL